MITPWIWILSLKYYWTALDLERRNQYCQRMSAANTVIRVVMIVSTDVTMEIQISTLSCLLLLYSGYAHISGLWCGDVRWRHKDSGSGAH